LELKILLNPVSLADPEVSAKPQAVADPWFDLRGCVDSEKHWKCWQLKSFLAHLSTKCSWWAIVTRLCPLCVVVRRPSCVVRKLVYLNILSSETTHWILTKLHNFTLNYIRKSSNDIFSWTAYGNLTKLNMNGPWVVPYQNCSNGSDWLDK